MYFFIKINELIRLRLDLTLRILSQAVGLMNFIDMFSLAQGPYRPRQNQLGLPTTLVKTHQYLT